jgi:hypothetical protein
MLDAQQLTQRLIEAGIARADQLRGCTENEIISLEQSFGLLLPIAYKDFLRVLGHSAGAFWRDVEFTADKLEWINRDAREILVELESTKLTLPSQALVFSWRQGEQFLFFFADGKSQNPPVYRFQIGCSEFVKVSDTFWDGIEGELATLEQVYNKIPPGVFPWVK